MFLRFFVPWAMFFTGSIQLYENVYSNDSLTKHYYVVHSQHLRLVTYLGQGLRLYFTVTISINLDL